MTTEDDNTSDSIVTQLVGEGKKFKTIEDLAQGKLESDSFIEDLKNENAQMREAIARLDQKAKEQEFDELYAKLKGQPQQTETENSEGENQAQPGLTLEQLESYLEVRKAKETAESRFSELRKRVSKVYVEKADEKLASAMRETGLTEDGLRQLASANVDAAVRALGLEVKPTSSNIGSGSVSSEAIMNQGPEVQNWAYFQKLQREMKESEFFSPKIQQAMIKARKALGDDFYK